MSVVSSREKQTAEVQPILRLSISAPVALVLIPQHHRLVNVLHERLWALSSLVEQCTYIILYKLGKKFIKNVGLN